MAEPVVDDVGHKAHDVFHLEPKLLEMLPLRSLLPVVHHNIGLFWTGGGSKADPPEAPVLHLLLCVCFDAPDELLDGLK